MYKQLVSERPLQVLPSLATCIGLNEAVVLQQIHFLLTPDHNKSFIEGHYWVHNTYEQWQRQYPFWSLKTIKSIFTSLKKQSLLIFKILNTKESRCIKGYRLNYAQLASLNKKAFQTLQTEGIKHPQSENQTSSLNDVRLS